MSWTARHLRTLELPTGVLSLDAAPDGGTLWTACVDGTVREVDAATGEHGVVGRHGSYASGVRRAAGSGGRERLVSAGYDGVLRVHDRAERRTEREIAAHGFWSWQLRLSPDGRRAASVSGQYLCGGYDYEPRPAEEPTVKVLDVASGETVHTFELLPPVLSTAFTPDGRHLAAANLMGDVRVWELARGEEVAAWRTPDFTGWGIIKGHYYTGGIYALAFTPDGEHLLGAGMGTTRDPAAGNGRQLWQRFAWRERPVSKVDATHEGESGQGLMETLVFAPHGENFVMGGRIAKGQWNVACFDAGSGSILGSLATKTRVTEAAFAGDGKTLFLAGAVKQPGPGQDGSWGSWGRIQVYAVPGPARVF